MVKRAPKKRKNPYARPIRWEEAQHTDDVFYFYNRSVVILYDKVGPDGRRRILTGEIDLELRDCDPVAVWLREEGNGIAPSDTRIGKTVVLSDYVDSVDETRVKDYEEEKDGYTQETKDYLWELGIKFADTEYAAFDLTSLAECDGAAEILKSFLRDLFYRHLMNEYRCIQERPLVEKALKKSFEEQRRRRKEWTEIGQSPKRDEDLRKIIESAFTEEEEFFSGYGSDGHRYMLIARYDGEDNFFSLWLNREKKNVLIGEIVDLTEYECVVGQLNRVQEEGHCCENLKQFGGVHELCNAISKVSAAADIRNWDLSPRSVIHGGPQIVEKYLTIVYKRLAEISVRRPSLRYAAQGPRGWRITKKDRQMLDRFAKKFQKDRPAK